MKPPAHDVVSPMIADIFPVELQAPELPRHGWPGHRGWMSRPSPLWLQEKTRRCGIRSIDAVVDVTNHVLLELGQPMHAFDLGKLRGGIVVRAAEPGNPGITLMARRWKCNRKPW